MAEAVWIIVASEGTYDDYADWIDSVHPTEESANERLKEQLKATLLGKTWDGFDRWEAGQRLYDVEPWNVDGKPKG